MIEQNAVFAAGKSMVEWPNSLHNSLPSRAVDAIPHPVDWNNIDSFYEWGGFVLGIAGVMGIDIRWGGHFTSFFDGPHFEVLTCLQH